MLLGPQRPRSNLRQAVERLAPDSGPIAVISSGWQEAEGDIDDVRELAGRPLHDLRLYHRAEMLFQSHPEFHAAYRARQDALKQQQRLYSLRLRHLMTAARQLMQAEGNPTMIAAEQRHAISQLRALDRHHVKRVQTIHREFQDRYAATLYQPLVEQVHAIRRELDQCQALLITGGNVLVLLNRIALFDLGSLIGGSDLIAWSAGAMVLSDRLLLFHDRLPEGRRAPELLGAGLGLVRGYVFLPDAKHRIRATDTVRLGLLSRRFASATCAMLDCDSLLQFDNGQLTHAEAARRIKSTGSIGVVRAS